jgi:hypothetical protein
LVIALMTGIASAKIPPPVPHSQTPPANAIVLVSHVPSGLGTVTSREFRHGLDLSAVEAGRDSPPHPTEKGYEKLKDRALGELLDSIWIQGQAGEMGISVTAGAVARELAAIKELNFKNEAEWRRFVREMHFTRRDIHERVELQVLSTRIQERIASSAHTQAGQRRAFAKFAATYKRRWRSRTVCTPGYMVAERCRNGAPPATS